MRKYFLFTATLLLSSPLALAQTAPPPTAPPSGPASPDLPVAPDPPEVEQHKPDENSQSGSVREDRNSVGATGNAKTQSAKGRVRSGSQANDFAMWDVDGDGKLTKDEVKGDAKLSGDFKAADKNGDGKLSRAEYEKAVEVQSPRTPSPRAPAPPK